MRRASRRCDELDLIIEQRIRAQVEALVRDGSRAELRAEVAAGRMDPWTAADGVLGS